ncbi:protein LST8 homolog [Nesidiocoris tenuis]|uniref:Target of rapamycin complex subunit lst8 n=1 Tax=Nesidiocoris tenuis TaxID=355587 RepID=A0ABN7AZ56_9HEMI|nr:protein LST8 homolog [Nesidiocoris tenuis]
MSGLADQLILATGGYDHTIKIWQANSGICKQTLPHTDSQVNALCIAPDKRHLAAAGHQHIRMYDLTSATTNPVTNYEGISKNVTAVGFAEHGQWMYTGSEDNTARIWDIRTKTFQCSRIFQVGASVNAVCLLPNQTEMIVGDQSGVIHVWDVRTDRNEQLIPETGASVQSVAVDRDARMMTAINNKGYCYVWNLTCVPGEPAKLKPKARIPAHAPSYGVHCTISPDTQLMASCSSDSTCKVWDTEDFQLIHEFRHELHRWVWNSAFTADSKYIFTGSSDHTARLWNLETGHMEREYSGHQKAVTAIALSDVQNVATVPAS